MATQAPALATQPELLLGFRFGVFFFSLQGKSDQVDLRFQKVSGLASSVKTTPLSEGGQNLYTQQLPTGIENGRLILERGMVANSPLLERFNEVLMQYKFTLSNVMVTLYDELGKSVSAWLFIKAFPVKWSMSELDANDKKLLIDRMELAYTRIQIVRP